MRRGILLILIVSLCACDPFSTPENLLQTYIERLERVLDVDAEAVTPVKTPAYPQARDRQLAVPALDVSLLRFLSLYGCELQVVVAERNAIMGRVMQPLNELRYELRFIRSAEKCLPKIKKPALRQDISEAIAHKKAHILEHIWQASFATTEMADFLRRSQGLFPVETARQSLSGLTQQTQALVAFTAAIQTGDWQQQPVMLAGLQQRWQQSATGGKLIRSAEAIIATLNQATAMITTRVGTRPMCYQQAANPQAQRMHSMFLSVYIAEVQPYLSAVSRASDNLFAAMSSLRSQLQPVMPASFDDYAASVLRMEGKNSLWFRLDKSVQLHTETWQDLLSQCGLQPGE